MGQSWIFSAVNLAFTLCWIASVSASSLGLPKPLCVNRNFKDILCRWKNNPVNTAKNGYGIIIAVKFATNGASSYELSNCWQRKSCYGPFHANQLWNRVGSQTFQECVEFNDTLASNYSSCVWDYPTAWVNETLSIKVVSSNQSANTSTVFDYDPNEHVILSPPIVTFTRRKIKNTVNLTMSISYPYPDTEHRILANCGPPKVNVIYTRLLSTKFEEYSEEGSWGDWRQAKDGSSWHVHPTLREHSTEKNWTNTLDGKRVLLGLFPINKYRRNYLTQVRWRVNNSSCRGYWGAYRTDRFSTDKIVVTPYNLRSHPGGNVTLKCESTIKLSTFMWIVTDDKRRQVNWTTPTENGCDSYLHLKNISTGHYTVECWSNETKGNGGVFLNVGAAPPPPVVECLMENKEILHCRYSVCNAQMEKQDHLFTNTLGVSWQSTSSDRSGFAEHKLDNCFSSYAINDDGMVYSRTTKIRATASNIFGSSESEITFLRDNQIHPSSPMLKESSVISDQGGAVVNMAAQFPKTKSSDHMHRYCEKFALSIGYKVIPNDTVISQINFATDSDFWHNWEIGQDELNNEDVNLMENATVIKVKVNSPMEDLESIYGLEPVRFKVSPLAANTRYLMSVKWKLASRYCRGDWSIPAHHDIRIGILKPPKFRNVTLVFLSEGFPLPGSFRRLNWTGDASLMVWYNINETDPGIQEHNIVDYKVVAPDESFLQNVSCHAGCSAIMSGAQYKHSLFQVNAVNEKGMETSPTFRRTHLSAERCTATVISMSLASISDSYLIFKVGWIYAKRSPPFDCVISPLEQRRIHVHLLTWREIEPDGGRNRNTETTTEEPPQNATVYTFNAKVVRSSFRPNEGVFGTRVSALSENVNFKYPFQADSAYGMGVALSEQSENMGTFYQSLTFLDANLYYFSKSPEQSKGAPRKVITSDIGMHQMKINWLPSKPQERNSPVLRYEIFAKLDKSCSFRHNETVCDSQEADSKNCYETPNVIYEVRNSSQANGWKIEERNDSNFMSVMIENLSPGTFYYITVWEVTAEGRNKCFRHVSERTLFSGHIWIIFALICVFFIVAGISLVAFRRKVKQIFGINIPAPRIWIPVIWKDTDNNEQPTTDEDFQDDDESNSYVALSRSREMTGGNVETNSDILDDFIPLMITITKQEPVDPIDIEEEGPQNNNELQKLCQSDCHLEVESPPTCATSVDSIGKTITESSSFESDEPCCSTSSIGNSWPRGNVTFEAGEDDEEAEDAYVSASEAASMSWPMENSAEWLLQQST